MSRKVTASSDIALMGTWTSTQKATFWDTRNNVIFRRVVQTCSPKKSYAMNYITYHNEWYPIESMQKWERIR